jgi:hypothetical protein
MIDVFTSPRLTLDRAHHHIGDLKKQIDNFVHDKPWAYVIENDPVTRHQRHKIRFARWLPPIFPCIVFDAVNNLRAVLDQSGYASAIASGKSNPKRTNFPFCDDPSGLDDNISRELRPKVGDEGVRRRIVGVFNASTSPPKE